MIKTKKLILTALCLPLLAGCFERHRTTDNLCEEYPLLCAELNMSDGQCRRPRTDLIWQRYEVFKNPTDQEKFTELQMTHAFQKCMELTARIEPTETRDRKNVRMTALLHSYDSIKRLNAELAKSEEPEIIYYRWSQGDTTALRQFLQLEGTPALETPEMQFALATFYTDKNVTKTIGLLNYALELYQEGQTIKPEILQTLATLSHRQGHKDRAYVWSVIGSEFGAPIVSQARLTLLYPMSTEKQAQLNQKAQEVISAIEQGNYKRQLME